MKYANCYNEVAKSLHFCVELKSMRMLDILNVIYDMKRYLNLIYHMCIIGAGLKDVVITTNIQNTQHVLFTVRPDNNIPLNFMVHKP